MITESADDLYRFIDDLDQVQELEKYLTFDPLMDVPDKLQNLRKLNLTHAQQLLSCQENAQEVEALLIAYNEVVEKLNAQMEYLGERLQVTK